MSNVPSDLRYAKSHEWVQVAGAQAPGPQSGSTPPIAEDGPVIDMEAVTVSGM